MNNTPQKKETNITTMKDVIFLWSSVSVPREQKNDEGKVPTSAANSPTAHLEFHSYEIKVLMSEKRFKALKKEFKGAKNLVNAKDFEKDDLLEAYDCLNDKDLDDEMVLVKFAQGCLKGNPDKNGVRAETFPIKQIGIKGKVQDIHGNNIEQETMIGNGTKGHFQFRPVENKYGLYLYPHLLCITELVEYAGGQGGEEDLDSLGIEELDDADMDAVGKEQSDEQSESNDDDVPEMFD